MKEFKKNGLLLLKYAIILLLCLAMVLLVDRLGSFRHGVRLETSEEESSLPEDGEIKETDEEELSEETENMQEELPRNEEASKKPKRSLAAAKEDEESRQEAYQPPTIVIQSDVHYFSSELTDYGEAFETMLKEDDGKLTNYDSQLMDAFTEEMVRLKPSAVILSGDLTLNGEKAGHEALAEKLRILEEKGVKVLVIPGNHDINNYHAGTYFGEEKGGTEIVDADGFCNIYRQFGYDQAKSRDENSLSYVYELDEKNWLLMLDTAQYEPVNKVGGRIKEETLDWMKEQLDAAEKEGINVLPIGHHNLLKESILYPEDCTLENSPEVIDLLEAYRLPLYISGHLHLERTKKYKAFPGEGDDVYHINEVVANSFAIPPCQYGILSWTENGGLVYRTQETDVAAWAGEQGITDENLLNFEEYGNKFLTQVISSQIYSQLKNFPEEQMEAMAELFGSINRDYCAGVPVDAQEIRSEMSFRLWERNLPDSRLFANIDEILRDTGKDHNSWTGMWKKTDAQTATGSEASFQ